MNKSKAAFKTIDDYIATFPGETQKMLEEVRATVRSAAPDAREKISYQIAAFELNGKNLIYFAGWKNHISVYPISTGDEAFNEAIAPYMAGKGTLQFPLNKPLPLDLISKIVELRIAGNFENIGMKSSNRRTGDKK